MEVLNAHVQNLDRWMKDQAFKIVGEMTDLADETARLSHAQQTEGKHALEKLQTALLLHPSQNCEHIPPRTQRGTSTHSDGQGLRESAFFWRPCAEHRSDRSSRLAALEARRDEIRQDLSSLAEGVKMLEQEIRVAQVTSQRGSDERTAA